MGLAGVGLPEDLYMTVARKLYEKDSSIICPSSLGGSCHSENFCSALNNSAQNIMFKFTVESDKSFQFPMTTLMRQRERQCDVLVTNIGKNNQASSVVLGSSFLQNFVIEYFPRFEDGKSTLYI